MPRDPLTIEAEVQQVLDELWGEKLIPFALTVGKITKASDEYTILFHDARMHSVRVRLSNGHPFRELVRAAVLARIAKLSGPLKNWHNKGLD